MNERRHVLAEGNRTRVVLVVDGSERWIEKALRAFADVGPERKRLAREARLGRLVGDPAVAATLGGLDGEECSMFRREYLDGTTLEDARATLSPREVAAVLERAVEVVARLHEIPREGGLIHGDLTLTNLYRMRDGSVRLTDLELSRFENETASDGWVPGTPSMLAPEVREGAPPSKASDVYQLGLVYLRLRGVEPRELRGTVWESVLATATTERPSARELLAALGEVG